MMKKILFFLIIAPFVLRAQNAEQQLRKGTWYVTGEIYLNAPLRLAADSSGDYDWKLTFLKNGKLVQEGITRESMFTAAGDEIAPGYHFKNSKYTYVFKNDLLKIDYTGTACDGSIMCRLAFYRVKNREDHKGYELERITEPEFKSGK